MIEPNIHFLQGVFTPLNWIPDRWITNCVTIKTSKHDTLPAMKLVQPRVWLLY